MPILTQKTIFILSSKGVMVAFTHYEDIADWIEHFYEPCPNKKPDELDENGFTVREIALLAIN